MRHRRWRDRRRHHGAGCDRRGIGVLGGVPLFPTTMGARSLVAGGDRAISGADDAPRQSGAGGVAVPPPCLGDGAVTNRTSPLPLWDQAAKRTDVGGRGPSSHGPGALSPQPPPTTGGGVSAFRRLLGPTLMTLAMLAILVGLGTWQIYRLHWKEGILSQIARA